MHGYRTNVQGTEAALTSEQKVQLADIARRLASNPASVDAGQLATGRNYAARGGYFKTMLQFDAEIARRGTGAQNPDMTQNPEYDFPGSGVQGSRSNIGHDESGYVHHQRPGRISHSAAAFFTLATVLIFGLSALTMGQHLSMMASLPFTAV